MGMSTCDTGVCEVQRRPLGPHWSNSQLAKALGTELGSSARVLFIFNL